MSSVLQELTFSQQSKTLPWLPDNVSDYAPWTDRHTVGTFTAEGERCVFLQLSENDGFVHYWVSLLPDGEEPHEVRLDEALMRTWLREHMVSKDRRNVTAYNGQVDAGFFYGVRYCKPCIICGKTLETVNTTDDAIVDQPSGGTNFTSHGHYGSTIFDPMGAEHLSINFCDPCLSEKAQQGYITHVQERKHIIDESTRKDFNPQQEDSTD